MHQGNWKCSTCGGAITELPFQPRSEAGLTCRTCYGKQKNSQSNQPAPEMEMDVAGEAPDIPDYAEVAGEPAPGDDFGGSAIPASSEKPKFAGNWQCAGCGGVITSLPFTPRDTSNLKCLDCFKKSKA
jgi:CxxC-x17-CxxC domain-containing protein